MSEVTTLIIILSALSMVCAVIVNALTRRPIKAAGIAVPVASLLLQIACVVHVGYMDPFAPIAFVVGAFWAFPVALFIGLIFHLGRRRAA